MRRAASGVRRAAFVMRLARRLFPFSFRNRARDRLRRACAGLIVQLFKRMIDQYDRLRRRGAFLEAYKKEDMFSHGLEEFDDSRHVVADLAE